MALSLVTLHNAIAEWYTDELGSVWKKVAWPKWGTILAFSYRDWGTTKNLRIPSVLAEIQTEHPLNTSLKHYCTFQSPWWHTQWKWEIHTVSQTENLKERNHLPHLDIHDKIILNFITQKEGMNVWTGFNWLGRG
jgi:hypothetical protein